MRGGHIQWYSCFLHMQHAGDFHSAAKPRGKALQATADSAADVATHLRQLESCRVPP